MARNFEAEIETAESQLEANIKRMEQIKQEFLSTTIEFIKTWYWEQTEFMVKHKPKFTKELDTQELSELKEEVKALQEDTPNIVTEFLQDESLWWHRKHSDQCYFFSENRPPNGLDRAVRLIAGKLASILEKYGYLTTKFQDDEVWREWDQSGNYHPPGARPYYPYGQDWPERMRTLTKQYEDIHREAVYRASEIEKLKEDKEKSEAEDIWNKA